MNKLSEIHDLFNKYFERGISVMPIIGKIAYVKNFQRWSEEKQTEEEINEFIDNDEHKKANGIGLICGPASGIICFDIDVNDPEVHDLVPPSPVRKVGAKGETRFYRYNGEVNDSLKGVFDFICFRKYTAIPPTLHPEGVYYKWITLDTLENTSVEDLPYIGSLDFMDKIKAMYSYDEKTKTTKKINVTESDGTRCRHGSWSSISSVMIKMIYNGEQFDKIRDEIIKLDEELNKGTVKLFQCKSRRWKTNDIIKNASCAIFEAYKNNYHKMPMPVDLKLLFLDPPKFEIIETTDQIIEEEKFDYPRFQGKAQQLFNYFYNSSRVKRTRFSIASTLSALSTMYGNRAVFNGLTTNMYLLIAGSSTSGKEDPVSLVDILFSSAGHKKLVAKNLASDSAILTEISPVVEKSKDLINEVIKVDFPTQLHIFKEASSLFYLANDDKNTYAKNMANIYQDLFTSFGKNYSGKNLKNERLGECFSPSISILGSMTDTDFESCLTPTLFDKGLGGRFLYFYDKEFKNLNRELKSQNPPDILMQYVKSSRSMSPIGMSIDPIINTEVFNLYDSYREEAHFSDGPISKAKGRLPEHFTKMMMLSALSRESEKIESNDFEWSKKWFETYIKELDILFSQKMHLSKMSKINTEVEQLIKASGKEGLFHSKLLKSSVCSKNSLDSKKLNDIINFLKETNSIVVSSKKDQGSRQSSKVYFHKKFVKIDVE